MIKKVPSKKITIPDPRQKPRKGEKLKWQEFQGSIYPVTKEWK